MWSFIHGLIWDLESVFLRVGGLSRLCLAEWMVMFRGLVCWLLLHLAKHAELWFRWDASEVRPPGFYLDGFAVVVMSSLLSSLMCR